MNPDKLDELLHLGQRIPHHPVSRIAGKIADSRFPPLKNLLIKGFIRAYKVNMAEAAVTNPKHYSSFNTFFTRPLAHGARPIAAENNSIVSPSDGKLSQFGNIDHDRLIQAKGKDFTLAALLGHHTESEKTTPPSHPDYCSHFENGKFATVYLSPSDYHRVH
ncbi:MAG: phosphatidylserine decarboxylase, partial [Pseudomonadales bacterium]|nr:phosphatidylserine decarboxylase [Pseudomonadales bacterium]